MTPADGGGEMGEYRHIDNAKCLSCNDFLVVGHGAEQSAITRAAAEAQKEPT